MLGHGARVLPLELGPVPGHGAQISARAPTKTERDLNLYYAAAMLSPRKIKSSVFARLNLFSSFHCEATRAKGFVFMFNSSRVIKD